MAHSRGQSMHTLVLTQHTTVRAPRAQASPTLHARTPYPARQISHAVQLAPRSTHTPTYAPHTTGPPQRAHAHRFDTPRSRGSVGGFPVQSSVLVAHLSRAVARVLMWVLVLQPVYVAYAVEVDAGAQESAVQGEDVQASGEGGMPEALGSVQGNEDAAPQGEAAGADGGMPSDGAAPLASDTHDAAADEAASSTVLSGEASSTDDTAVADAAEGHVDGALVSDGEAVEIPEDARADTTTGTDTGGAAYTPASGTSTIEASSSPSSPSPTDSLLTGAASSTESVASSTDDREATDTDPIIVPKQYAYTFDEGDCTLVANGEFYCIASGPERQATSDPRVYAEKDREGDREIYYFDGVEVHRITNNGYDDFAPVFDSENLQIAWQAMIQDRLQVMLYDVPTRTTRQVTMGRENASNPDLAHGMLVFQQWVGTNWEVMRTAVPKHGEPFEIEQMTDNAVHDMFPRVYDHLITWQREKGSSWEVVVYDFTTGRTHELEKSDTTRYDHPRFALLFDSTHNNGDVETVGYDLESGEMMELGTRANPQPIVPRSPKDEVPDAPVQAASSSAVKVAGRDEGEGNDESVW